MFSSVHKRSMCRLVLAIAFLAGCGGPTYSMEPVDPLPPEPAEPMHEAPRTEGTIDRAELDPVLEAGLGRFLGRVTTEPHLENGRFVGHRLTALRSDLFEGVDLRAGDTLLRVNGMPIERPEQALAAWNALRVASELTIDYLREGERRQLRFAIED